MGFLGFLATPLGYVMEFLYNIVQNYGIALIIFTLLTRIAMFPITLRQQKSSAKNAAYQPMMQEIQKKWANDKQKQQQEIMKFQEENNIKMTAGCGSMLINFVVLFSVIEVIYRPLKYILHIPADVISKLEELLELTSGAYANESTIIGQVIGGNSAVIEELGGELTSKITGFNFNFLGLDLSKMPKLDNGWVYLILPILSIALMFLMQFITMRTSGQAQGGKAMLIMTLVMGVWFGWYAFTVPVAFSLYYAASNLFSMIQQIISKKIYDPEKFKQQILEEFEERKKQKKAKKKFKIEDETGNIVEKELSEAELVKLRLELARKQDAEKYAETEDEKQAAEEAAERAKELDEEKYDRTSSLKTADEQQKATSPKEEDETPDIVVIKEQEPAAPVQEYKPGRRKRARQKKEEGSFVEQEQARETNDEQ